jgi:hypothetical protein
MRNICIGISGFSGSGKDEIAKSFVKRGAIQLGLADPAKRHMADLYDFTEQQLFGPSKFRNGGDLRYPKPAMEKLQSWNGPKPEGEGLIGNWDDDATYWWFEGRGRVEGIGYNNDDPYIPLRLGSARVFIKQGDPRFWLSPREALQKYCELMNTMYGDTWIRKGIDTSLKLAEAHHFRDGIYVKSYKYSQMEGLRTYSGPNEYGPRLAENYIITCFADFRHKHEINYLRRKANEALTPVLIRIKRPGIDKPPFNHRSETEQATIEDGAFDFVVQNDGTLEELDQKVEKILTTIRIPR